MSESGAKQSQEETILTLLAANHSLQREIAALREAVRCAYFIPAGGTYVGIGPTVCLRVEDEVGVTVVPACLSCDADAAVRWALEGEPKP